MNALVANEPIYEIGFKNRMTSICHPDVDKYIKLLKPLPNGFNIIKDNLYFKRIK